MIDLKLLEYLDTYLTENRRNRFNTVLAKRTRHFTVATEDVYQLHNTSAVIRSCDVFGLQDIHIIENKYNSKVSRHVAKGSQKWTTFHRYKKDTNNTVECFEDLRKKGIVSKKIFTSSLGFLILKYAVEIPYNINIKDVKN